MGKLKKILLIGIPLVIVLTATFFIVRSYQNNKTFTVTFDSNGGSKVESQEVKLNEKVEEPEDPTKEGYIFKGWYLSGKKYDFDKKVTKDIKLKARWTKMATEEVVTQPVVVPTPVVNKKDAKLLLEAPEVFYVNRETTFGLTVIANDYKDTMVVGKATISEPNALEKLEYKGADGKWYELSLDETFGGKEGFALVDGTNEFRAIFNEVGEYKVTVQLLNVQDNKVMAEVTTTIAVQKKSAELTLTAEEPFYLNEVTPFVISVVANDDVNTKVIGKATISEPSALERLEYKGADDNWYELSLEDDFGESEGFELVDGESEFKAAFNKEGIYEVKIQLLNVQDNSVVAETKETIKVELEPAEVTFEMPEEFVVGKTAEFTVSTEANDYENLIVVGTGGLSNPEAIEKLEYYEVRDGNWYELPADTDFGGANGFELTDATSKFRVTFKTAGEYTASFQILNAETREVVAESEATIVVREPIAPTIEFEVEEDFIVGFAQEFTISTEANDYEGLMVVGIGGLSNPEAIEKLEYYEVRDGNWYELPTDVDFGGAGFPLQDATSRFRVTFKTAGNYTVEYAVADAETKEEVASNATEITVREAIDAEVIFEIPTEFVVGQATEFTVSTEANDYEGLMVVGTGGLSNPEAIGKLEYYEVNDGNWYELPAGTDFGPATGFPLQDATSRFRVTFETAGEYEVEFQILNAETRDVVAESETTLTVVEDVQA